MMEWRVPLADLDFGVEEKQAVLKVMERRWLTMGALTEEFEQLFAVAVGVKHAIAVTNATAALHLACLSLGIGPGDEVIVPAMTFVATANAVLYTGAGVCFADIGSIDDLTISPQDIERCITSRTRAIIVMHYGGYACHMPEIMEIASVHGLAVIEDAAHAPGASLNNRSLGTWGDAGCFSFFSNKNLTTGEGGMLVTNRDDVAEKMRLLRSHGMTSLTWERHQGRAHSYDVVDLGYNYRIDEIRSALGIVQLSKLAENNDRRREITEQYRLALQGCGIDLPFSSISGKAAYHIFPVMLPELLDRGLFIDRMKQAGIQTSVHYPPIHLFSYYRTHYPQVSLPVTETAASREVTLPLYPGMNDEDVEAVVTEARSIMNSLEVNYR